MKTLKKLIKTIKKQKFKNPKVSYTSSLFRKGKNFCIKKFKEESKEFIDAINKNNKKNSIHETADLIYHLLVLIEFKKINFNEILKELQKREKLSGIEEKKNRQKNVR